MLRNSKGFTLIELLVVISIISLLSSIVLATLNSARGKANTAAALQFSSQNHTALGAYSALDAGLNEGTGSQIYDGFSVVPISGTVDGTTWVTNTPTGKGSALHFNGSNNYVQGTMDGSTFVDTAGNAKDFTISAWFKQDTAGTWAAIFSNSVGTNDTPIMTMRNNTNEFGMMRVGVAETGVYVDLGSDHYGKWIYGVITYKKATNTLSVFAYKDGKLLKNSTTLSWTLQKTDSYYIGRHYQPTPFYFTGSIDDVHVYGDTLSFAQIQEHYLAESGRYGIPSSLAVAAR